MKYHFRFLGLLSVVICILCGFSRAADPAGGAQVAVATQTAGGNQTTEGAQAEDELSNDGEDITKPLNRFDVRLQARALPDSTNSSGETFDDRHSERMTLRTDWVFFSKPDQLSLRVDLPFVWSNKPTSQNSNGATKFGLGDLLMQAAYVHQFDARWAAAAGLQMILPTATGDAFGSGKLQLSPGAAVRMELPEISEGSYTGLIVRQFVSVAGDPERSKINYLELQPQLNLSLPDSWFINSSPKLRCNCYTGKWFVPLDIMVGKKFGTHWIVSLEYQYGLVTGYQQYNEWLEARIGYFF